MMASVLGYLMKLTVLLACVLLSSTHVIRGHSDEARETAMIAGRHGSDKMLPQETISGADHWNTAHSSKSRDGLKLALILKALKLLKHGVKLPIDIPGLWPTGGETEPDNDRPEATTISEDPTTMMTTTQKATAASEATTTATPVNPTTVVTTQRPEPTTASEATPVDPTTVVTTRRPEPTTEIGKATTVPQKMETPTVRVNRGDVPDI